MVTLGNPTPPTDPARLAGDLGDILGPPNPLAVDLDLACWELFMRGI